MDHREGPKPRVAVKSVDIDRFFLDLYISIGECLPDKFIRRGARLEAQDAAQTETPQGGQ